MKIRNSIKALLLNDEDQILLIKIDDPRIVDEEGNYNGPFWDLIGGKIEENENVEDAVVREIYEETGIKSTDIELGPIVWSGELLLNMHGNETLIKQRFIVARTSSSETNFDSLTQYEQGVVLEHKWFSLDDLNNSKEIIYPKKLKTYLPDILIGKLPNECIGIEL